MNVDSDPSKPEAGAGDQQWKPFALWMLVALVAALAAIPYTIEIMSAAGRVVTLGDVASAIIAERMFLSAFAIGIGLILGVKVGLGHPSERNWRQPLLYAIICGIGVGIAVSVVSPWLERSLVREWPDSARRVEDVANQMEPWKTVLVSFSAGVTEELLFRFGAMTFFAWLGAKMARHQPPGGTVVWIANLLAAVLFGLLHLSNVVEFGIPITVGIVLYVTLINGAAGIIFGWLYWRRGIGAAMLSHVVADIVLKVIVPMVTFSFP